MASFHLLQNLAMRTNHEHKVNFFLPNQHARPHTGAGGPLRRFSAWSRRIARNEGGWSDLMIRSSASLLSLFLCLFATAALAQSPDDIIKRVESFFHSAFTKSAQSRWSKLPEAEYSCVDQKLRERGDNLQSLIKRGVFPGDRRIADIRSQCRGALASQQFQRLDNQAYKRSGQGIVVTVSSYHDCENACSQSSSCSALTYFRAEKLCRIMQSTTELIADEGADSATRIESITGSVAPQTPSPTERTTREEPTRPR